MGAWFDSDLVWRHRGVEGLAQGVSPLLEGLKDMPGTLDTVRPIGANTINRETGMGMGEPLRDLETGKPIRDTFQPPDEQAGMLDAQKANLRARRIAGMVKATSDVAAATGVTIDDEDLVATASRIDYLLETRDALNKKLASAHNEVRQVYKQRKSDAKAQLLAAADNGRKLPTLKADSVDKHLNVIRECTVLRSAADDLLNQEARGWLDACDRAGVFRGIADWFETWAATDLSGDDVTLKQVREHEEVFEQAKPTLKFLWSEYQAHINGGVTDSERRWVFKQVAGAVKDGRSTLPTIEELRESTYSSMPTPVNLLLGEDYQAQLDEERAQSAVEAADAARSRMGSAPLTVEEKEALAVEAVERRERTPEEQARVKDFISSRRAEVESKDNTTKGG